MEGVRENVTRYIGAQKSETPGEEHRLVVMDGNIVREIGLRTEISVFSFGRDENCDILLHSALVSRIHGYFFFREDALYVMDGESLNGIQLNGKPIQKGESGSRKLVSGDILRIDNDDSQNPHSKGVLFLYTTRKSNGSWKQLPLSGKETCVIGRENGCDIVLDNISVSRRHAEIRKNPAGKYILSDLGSFNGVFVNGKRITAAYELCDRDVIGLANAVILYTSGILLYKSDNGGVRILMNDISREVKGREGKKAILQHVNLEIEPNTFVAIIGGSGAGKSTVMNAMSGFEQATSGHVFLNQMDLYQNYAIAKNTIGYVPQQDIIYENLSLRKMLSYSAKLRMPADVQPEEQERRIDEVLSVLDLAEHKNKMIRALSGGQKKRASIAVELLADPGLFFLDEPTSGLDPGTEESLMKTLSRLSKEKGKTIIAVTHTTQNLHLCDKILFMGKGGRVCYYGSPQECLTFFGVKTLTEVYNLLQTNEAAKVWSERFYAGYGRIPHSPKQEGIIQSPKRSDFLRQFGILCARYINLIANDLQRLCMLFLQPVLIAFLLYLVAGENVFSVYNPTKSILFALSCAAIWMGLFNSIQEICKERTILKREYMANLRLDSYVLSKFTVQFLMSVVQTTIMAGLFFLLTGGPSAGILFGKHMDMLITVCLTIFTSSAIGLMVSSLFKNSDKAMTAAPFLLIVQLLFSGILFKLEGATKLISYGTVSRWSVEALGSIADLNRLPLEQEIPGVVREAEDIYRCTAAHLGGTWIVLLGFVVLCLICCIYLLRGVAKDAR